MVSYCGSSEVVLRLLSSTPIPRRLPTRQSLSATSLSQSNLFIWFTAFSGGGWCSVTCYLGDVDDALCEKHMM
jgi:hypothetical protein